MFPVSNAPVGGVIVYITPFEIYFNPSTIKVNKSSLSKNITARVEILKGCITIQNSISHLAIINFIKAAYELLWALEASGNATTICKDLIGKIDNLILYLANQGADAILDALHTFLNNKQTQTGWRHTKFFAKNYVNDCATHFRELVSQSRHENTMRWFVYTRCKLAKASKNYDVKKLDLYLKTLEHEDIGNKLLRDLLFIRTNLTYATGNIIPFYPFNKKDITFTTQQLERFLRSYTCFYANSCPRIDDTALPSFALYNLYDQLVNLLPNIEQSFTLDKLNQLLCILFKIRMLGDENAVVSQKYSNYPCKIINIIDTCLDLLIQMKDYPLLQQLFEELVKHEQAHPLGMPDRLISVFFNIRYHQVSKYLLAKLADSEDETDILFHLQMVSKRLPENLEYAKTYLEKLKKKFIAAGNPTKNHFLNQVIDDFNNDIVAKNIETAPIDMLVFNSVQDHLTINAFSVVPESEEKDKYYGPGEIYSL